MELPWLGDVVYGQLLDGDFTSYSSFVCPSRLCFITAEQ